MSEAKRIDVDELERLGAEAGPVTILDLRRDWLIGVAWFGSATAPEFSREDQLLFRTMAHRASAIILQQRTQAALQESDERHRLAIEAAGLGTWDRNLLTGELTTSERARRVLGLDPAREVGWDEVLARVHPDDREALSRLGRPLDPADPAPEVELEYRVRLPDGSLRWVSSRARVMLDERIAGRAARCVGTVLDITTRHEGEAALRRHEQELREAIRARDEVLHIVSHDLKNPLGVIVLNAALVGRLAGSSRDERERIGKAAETTCRAASRMQRLIGDLLQLSAIDAGRLAVTLAPVDLRSIAREALEAIASAAEQRSIALGLELPPDEVEVQADRERIHQVLENLLANALQHTPTRGKITVRVTTGAEQAACEVADTGPGVPPEAMPHLFERYYQGPKGERRGVAGLGLYIARGIVESHGGRIGVQSGPGGATFRFTIPRAR